MNSVGYSKIVRKLRVFTQVAAFIATLAGALVLTGWILDVSVLKGLFDGTHPLNPVTGAAFVVAGVTLWLQRREEGGFLRTLAHAFAILLTLVGGICTIESMFDLHPLLDGMIFPERLASLSGGVSLRVEQNAAGNLFLIGLALRCLDWETPRGVRPAQVLALGATLVLLLVFAGFFYSAAISSAISAYLPISLSTAFVFAVLAVGLLCARPESGLMSVVTRNTAGAFSARRLVLATILVPFIGGWLFIAGQRAGVVDVAMGTALFVVANIVVFLSVIWWTARSLEGVDSERELTRERLRNSEALYHSLVENLPQNVYRKDTQGRFIFANKRYCTTVDRQLEEVLGRSEADIIAPARAEVSEDQDRVVLTSGESFETVEEVRVNENEKIFYQVIKTPVRDARGHIIGVQGVFWDITSRIQAEQALLQERYLLHTLMDNFPDQIYFKDSNSRFIRVNKSLTQRFAVVNPALVEGKTDFDFFTQEYALKTFEDERKVMRTGQPIVDQEEKQTWPGGGATWVSTTKMPLRDLNGKIVGSFGISRDMTERIRFVDQLKQNNEDLARSEAALRQTMADLTKAHEQLKAAQLQLIQAEKMESVGTLAAGVAHEVKNPLAIMLMGTEFLTKSITVKSEDVAMVLQEMRDAVARADGIIRGLLDFSAAQQLEMEMTPVESVIEQSLTLIRHELIRHSVDLQRNFAPNLPPVGVDRNQFQQVFVNIFMNAIQAMGEAGGTLTVRTSSKVLTDGGHIEGTRVAGNFWVNDEVVLVEVEDSGPGIPAEFLSKIFDPFFTTKPAGLGTGLGLSVTKKIIEMHDGNITIANLPTRGVRVSIMLKARRKP